MDASEGGRVMMIDRDFDVLGFTASLLPLCSPGIG